MAHIGDNDMRFKVGDRVKVVMYSGKFPIGHIGTVTSIGSGRYYRLDGDVTGEMAHHFELFEEAPKTPEELVAEYKRHVAEWLRHHGELQRLKKLLQEQGWSVQYSGTLHAYFTKVTTERIPPLIP